MVPAPPLGWTSIRPCPPRGACLEREAPDARCRTSCSIVRLASDGTLELEGGVAVYEGVGRLDDGLDVGDSYNYAPPPDDVQCTSRMMCTSTSSPGARCAGSSSSFAPTVGKEGSVEVAMHVELRAGEPFCRLRVSFDNPCRNHRLRFQIPLPERTEASAAEGCSRLSSAASRQRAGTARFRCRPSPRGALSTRAESRCCSTMSWSTKSSRDASSP